MQIVMLCVNFNQILWFSSKLPEFCIDLQFHFLLDSCLEKQQDYDDNRKFNNWKIIADILKVNGKYCWLIMWIFIRGGG